MPKITCEDCRRPYQAAQPNAKRCPLCRLLRDWLACSANPVKCSDCGVRFLRSYRDQQECPSCDLIYAGLSPAARRARKLSSVQSTAEPKESNCALCPSEVREPIKGILLPPFPRIHPELRLCTGCAAAPANLEQVRRAVKRKIRALRAAATPTSPPA